jgi:hypothetical protein
VLLVVLVDVGVRHREVEREVRLGARGLLAEPVARVAILARPPRVRVDHDQRLRREERVARRGLVLGHVGEALVERVDEARQALPHGVGPHVVAACLGELERRLDRDARVGVEVAQVLALGARVLREERLAEEDEADAHQLLEIGERRDLIDVRVAEARGHDAADDPGVAVEAVGVGELRVTDREDALTERRAGRGDAIGGRGQLAAGEEPALGRGRVDPGGVLDRRHVAGDALRRRDAAQRQADVEALAAEQVGEPITRLLIGEGGGRHAVEGELGEALPGPIDLGAVGLAVVRVTGPPIVRDRSAGGEERDAAEGDEGGSHARHDLQRGDRGDGAWFPTLARAYSRAHRIPRRGQWGGPTEHADGQRALVAVNVVRKRTCVTFLSLRC